MYKITLTAGIEFTRVHTRVVDVEGKLAAIRGALAIEFGGYTETDTYGGWIGPDDKLVQERGKQWTILVYPHEADPAVVPARARGMAQYIAAMLNQESVVAEVSETRFEFVGQPVHDTAPASEAAP